MIFIEQFKLFVRIDISWLLFFRYSPNNKNKLYWNTWRKAYSSLQLPFWSTEFLNKSMTHYLIIDILFCLKLEKFGFYIMHGIISFLLIATYKLLSIRSQKGFPGGASGKESACQCRRCNRRCKFDPWIRKIPWKRKWQPVAIFFPRESHGQRSLDHRLAKSHTLLNWLSRHTCVS